MTDKKTLRRRRAPFAEIFYILFISVATAAAAVSSVVAATAASSAIAKEKQYEADSDNDPDVFAVKKITQAVHSEPPSRRKTFSVP